MTTSEPGCAKLLLVAGRRISQTSIDPIDVPGYTCVDPDLFGLGTLFSPTDYPSQFRRGARFYGQWSTAVTLAGIFSSRSWAGTNHVFSDSTVVSAGIVAGKGWNEREIV